MYRLLVIMMGGVLLAGCGSLNTSDFLTRTGDALSKVGQRSPTAKLDQEIKPLLEQPYIDPLTEYLERYEEDPTRTAQFGQVEQERDRRCAAVARRYSTDEATETGLALYRRGYGFSCPKEVAAYEARLKAMRHSSTPAQQPAENTQTHSAGETQEIAFSRQLNECYLLTRIRNFSGALQACRGPAEEGVSGAQASMAQIQYALGNHESAYRWARQAVPESAEAANLLGEIYAQGLGVAQDKEAAAKWFRTAAGLGHAGAGNALDKLASAGAGANAD